MQKNEFWAMFTYKTFNEVQRYAVPETLSDYKIGLIVAYCALFAVGIYGNAWVAFVIGRLLLDGRKGRKGFSKASMASVNNTAVSTASIPAPKPIQIYIFALCCCDLIVLCFLIFLILDLAYGSWIAPSSTFLCRLYLCSECLNKFCGPFFLVALSGYCYVRVCRNDASSVKTAISEASLNVETKDAKKLICSGFALSKTLLRTRVCLVVIGICLCLAFILMTPVYLYGDVHFLILHNNTSIFSITPKCAFQPAENILTTFTIYSFICGYLVPASLFTFFYASIVGRAYRHAKLRSKQQRQTSTLSNNKSQRSPKSYLGRVVKTTLGLVLFYLLCWTPYWALVIRAYMIPHDEQGRTTNSGVVLSYFLHILPYVNCTGYPILYTVLNKSITDSYKIVKQNKDLRNSKLAFLARQQSERKMLTSNALQPTSRCESGCSSVFFSDMMHSSAPKWRQIL